MTFQNLKEQIFSTLENDENIEKKPIQNHINLFLSILILANVFAMILETMQSFSLYSSYFLLFENISLSVFTIEYIARIWTYRLHKKYSNISSFILSPMMIFDALVLIPHILTLFIPNLLDLRLLRIIRVFRIFRLYKYSQLIDKILSVTIRHKKVLLSALSFIMMIVVTSATLMYFAEKDAQPEKFASIPHSIYWAIITISTVGFGDVYPITNIGKVIAVFTTITGVAIYALPTSILGAAFYAELMSKESHFADKLKDENEHLQYLLNNAQRETKVLRGIIKKEREETRQDDKKIDNKITKKFLNLFK